MSIWKTPTTRASKQQLFQNMICINDNFIILFKKASIQYTKTKNSTIVIVYSKIVATFFFKRE